VVFYFGSWRPTTLGVDVRFSHHWVKYDGVFKTDAVVQYRAGYWFRFRALVQSVAKYERMERVTKEVSSSRVLDAHL
jgi:hypothetical protein